MYGKQLLDEENKHLHDTEKLNLKFAKGWADRFKKRYGLRFRPIHGEAISPYMDAIEHLMKRIRLVVMTFHPRDT